MAPTLPFYVPMPLEKLLENLLAYQPVNENFSFTIPAVANIQHTAISLQGSACASLSLRAESEGAYSATDVPISCCTTQQQVILVQSSILYTSHELNTALWACF